MRRVLVVVNPISGRRKGLRSLPRFLAAFRGHGGTADVFRTTAAGDAARAAREAVAEGMDAVVAVGGDGTVNEVLNGLSGTSVPVGVLPAGTANLLARDLAIPFDPARAARVVALDEPLVIDTAEARATGVPPRRFLCTAGAGFDGAVVTAVHQARRGGLGFRGWIRPIARTIRDYEFPALRVTVDDVPAAPCTLAIVCNTRTYGGLFRLAPDARPDDGRLDVCLVDARRRRAFFRYLWAAWRGTLPAHDDVAIAGGRRIRVDADAAVPVQVDGDPCGTTPLEIDIRVGGARVLAPAPDLTKETP